jgi:hypothetical protein
MASRRSGPRWWRQRGGHSWEQDDIFADRGHGTHRTRSDGELNGEDGVVPGILQRHARVLCLRAKSRGDGKGEG